MHTLVKKIKCLLGTLFSCVIAATNGDDLLPSTNTSISPPNPRSDIFATITTGEKAFREAMSEKLSNRQNEDLDASVTGVAPLTKITAPVMREILPLAVKHGLHAIITQESFADTEGILRIRESAGQGSHEAAFFLGLFYLYGTGLGSLGQDEESAMQWFRKAAKAGHNDARCAVGLFLYHGYGRISKNRGVAASYFELASKDGHSYGHWLLGRFFYEEASAKQLDKHRDENVDINGKTSLMKEAARLFSRVKDEIPEAVHQLAVMYEYTLVRDDDLGLFSEEAPISNFRRAAKLYEEASRRGIIESTYHLALMNAYGRGIAQDYLKAAKLFQQAATNKIRPHVPSMRYLAIIQANGHAHPNGIPNYNDALYWYELCVSTDNFPDVSKLCNREKQAIASAIEKAKSEAKAMRESLFVNQPTLKIEKS